MKIIIKNIFKISLLLVIISILNSCVPSKLAMTPNEIKLMTTKQFDNNYEIVFKSAMSLLQSEQFIIEYTDMSTGLIRASKRIQNKNADLNRFLWGATKDAATAKGVILIDKVNDGVTVVKLTIYQGVESSSNGAWGNVNHNTKEEMVTDPAMYNNWFVSLSAEIEGRKMLR